MANEPDGSQKKWVLKRDGEVPVVTDDAERGAKTDPERVAPTPEQLGPAPADTSGFAPSAADAPAPRAEPTAVVRTLNPDAPTRALRTLEDREARDAAAEAASNAGVPVTAAALPAPSNERVFRRDGNTVIAKRPAKPLGSPAAKDVDKLPRPKSQYVIAAAALCMVAAAVFIGLSRPADAPEQITSVAPVVTPAPNTDNTERDSEQQLPMPRRRPPDVLREETKKPDSQPAASRSPTTSTSASARAPTKTGPVKEPDTGHREDTHKVAEQAPTPATTPAPNTVAQPPPQVIEEANRYVVLIPKNHEPPKEENKKPVPTPDPQPDVKSVLPPEPAPTAPTPAQVKAQKNLYWSICQKKWPKKIQECTDRGEDYLGTCVPPPGQTQPVFTCPAVNP